MRSVLGGVLIAALAALPALASEMTMPEPQYYTKAWYYDWTGFYLGAFSGYARPKTDSSTIVTTSGVFDSASSLTINNIPFGGQLGFDYASPWLHVLVGIAVDANSGFDHTTTFANGAKLYTEEMKIAASGTVRARLGYAFNNVLLYGTGGWAWAIGQDTRTQIAGTIGTAHPGTIEQASPNLTGWTAGGGASLGFWHNWELFAEYRYVSYGSATAIYPLAQQTTTLTTTVSSVLAGLNVKFNPIVGR
jgi:outer membrane immunogenic protein